MSEENAKKQIVQPSILSGFQEYLPRDQMAFNNMMDKIRYTFESYGFIPLDTPVLEKSEVLLAKSGGDTAKQVYRFTKGDTDMAMRFDLTVPLARYVAQHAGELTFPFRRYHIGKVYRGERPQKGRFREFYQCDIDVIGNGSLSISNDAEIVSIICSVFRKLDIGDFTVMINNRKLLNGYFDSLGVEDKTETLRIVDKLDKIGAASVKEELGKIGIGRDTADSILALTAIKGTTKEILAQAEALPCASEQFRQGIKELKKVTELISAYGVPEENFTIDLKIARGLDYYTGTVYETKLNDYPELGSICSGGRYDELAANYTKQSLPGVGISIGLSRLFYQLREAGILKEYGSSTPAKLLMVPMAETVAFTLGTAAELRDRGLNVEVYLGEGKLGKKFSYADKLGIRYVAVIGTDEMESGLINVKDMTSGEQKGLSVEEIAELIK